MHAVRSYTSINFKPLTNSVPICRVSNWLVSIWWNISRERVNELHIDYLLKKNMWNFFPKNIISTSDLLILISRPCPLTPVRSPKLILVLQLKSKLVIAIGLVYSSNIWLWMQVTQHRCDSLDSVNNSGWIIHANL